MPLHSQTVITATAIKSPSKPGGLRKRDLLSSETKMTIVSSMVHMGYLWIGAFSGVHKSISLILVYILIKSSGFVE